jgi:acyl-CoA synthetase (AMP-forming)/AMP-acid ligase II
MSLLTYPGVWEAIAAAVPDRPAQIQGPRVISWRGFNRRANGLAQHLVDAGLTRQSKMAAFLYNGPEYIESYFAAFKAALVPVNTNYRYRAEELQYLFDNADAEAVVFHAGFAPVLEEIRGKLPLVKAWVAVPEPGCDIPAWAQNYETVVGRGTDANVEPAWGRSEDDLLLMYTGGTTGMPKGVMWRLGDLFRALGGGGNVLLGLPPLESTREAGERAKSSDGESGAVALACAPLMHATAQFSMFITLAGAGTVASLPSHRFDAVELFNEIERLGVTSIAIVGMAFAAPMLETLERNPGRWTLPTLRRIGSSGTVWNQENKAGLLKHLPHVMLFDSLGSSEAIGIGASASGAGAAAETAKFQASPNIAVFSEDGRRIAPGSGEKGLVALSGITPAGYYKDPEKSARTFRTFEGQRWSVPGDFAVVEADGSLTFLGRGSQVINTGGEKVFPEEVEESLKRFPGVRDAAVVGVPDPRFGERICAVVELADDAAAPSLRDLAAHVKSQLADYKAPRELVIAPVNRAPNGKLDYKAVRARALEALGVSA